MSRKRCFTRKNYAVIFMNLFCGSMLAKNEVRKALRAMLCAKFGGCMGGNVRLPSACTIMQSGKRELAQRPVPKVENLTPKQGLLFE